MKSIFKLTIIPALLALLVMSIAACNKKSLDTEKAIHILVNGYNGGSNALQMSIDTTKFNKSNYVIKPVSMIPLNFVYTYRSQQQRFLTITDTITKKVVFSKVLPATGTKVNFNFIYVDDRELAVNPPAVDPGTNKLGFYINYTENDEPFDVFLYRMDDNTGQEYRYYLARNVKPKTWVYMDYLAPSDFNSTNLLNNTQICFTRTGTTDVWAFQDSEAMSKLSASGFSLPKAGEKGLLQPYFITLGTFRLDFARLFFYPDRS